MSKDLHITPNPQVVETEISENEIALVNLDTKKIYSMNPTGIFIWRKLKNGESPANIAKAMEQEFDVSQDKAQKDTVAWLSILQEHGLLS